MSEKLTPGDVGDMDEAADALSSPVEAQGEFVLDSASGISADVDLSASVLQRLALAPTGPAAESMSEHEIFALLSQVTALVGVASAAQARLAVMGDAKARARQAEQGVPAHKRGAGVASEVGLARRESPNRGARRLGLAKILTTEMPHTFAALASGVTSEYRAEIVARATACLELEDRRAVDAQIGPELADMSDRQVESRARALAYRADPTAATRAAGRAAEERFVSIRPAPDVMAKVTGCLPAAEGVACWAALDSAARAARSAGDERTLNQLRADLFIARLTGRDPADAGPDIEVGIIIPAETLFDGDDAPAHLTGYGPVPAPLARDLIAGRTTTPTPSSATTSTAEQCDEQADEPSQSAASSEARKNTSAAPTREQKVFWRRLFTSPEGTVQTIDARRRFFTGTLRKTIIYRDRTCRTPYCEAPIRDLDHITRVEDGGEESWGNGQGLCGRCNQAREAPGWTLTGRASGPLGARTHTVTITTPSGHTYTSRPPPAGP